MRRGYVDTPGYGQIHYHYLEAEVNPGAQLIVCLHPIPYSGLYFTRLAPLLNQSHDVIAVDYPGYGGSQRPEDKPSIEDFAGSLFETLAGLNSNRPCSLLGFHTGCLVSIELSLRYPELVGDLILIDIPYFDKNTREKLYDQVTGVEPVTTDLTCLSKAWEFNITNRIKDMPLERAYELFIEHIRTGEQSSWGFHAAFTYPCEDRFKLVKHPGLILATQSGLLEPTRQASTVIPENILIECLEITSSVMETGTESVARHVLDFITSTSA